MHPLARDVFLFCAVHLYLVPCVAVALIFVAWGHSVLAGAAALLAAAAYLYLAYDGSEYRDGRLWPWFSEVLLRTHSYFPVEMRLWNGARFSTSPEPAHARIYDLPGRPYMFAIHPHGPLPATAAILIPELTRWGGLFIKYLRFGVASAIFKVPVLRDLHLWSGCVDASGPVLAGLLGRGMSVAVLPGGIAEQLLPDEPATPLATDDASAAARAATAPAATAPPEVLRLILLRRKGFVRLALSHGAALVPVLGFGERKLYRTVGVGKLARALCRKARIGIPLAHGRWFTVMPYKHPFTIVMGQPIDLPKLSNPSDTEVDKWHAHYVQALRELFAQHAPQGASLVIV